MAQAGAPAAAATQWDRVPATYVVCSADRTIPPILQRRLAARVGRSVELPTGHSPFLSQPERVVELLARLAAEVAASNDSGAAAARV